MLSRISERRGRYRLSLGLISSNSIYMIGTSSPVEPATTCHIGSLGCTGQSSRWRMPTVKMAIDSKGMTWKGKEILVSKINVLSGSR